MYDKDSRTKRAYRILRTLEDYYGKEKIKKLTLLDVGSSTGIIDYILADKFNKVVGIDIDIDAIDYAKRSFIKKNLEFKLDDAMGLSLKKEVFDVVICAQIYEHVPSPQKLLSEIYRVLKPGGVCYFAAINKLWPWEPHYNLPFLSWVPKNIAHIYVQIFGKAKNYYETPKTYWELSQITSAFKRVEYTEKILKDPIKFGYDNSLGGTLAPILKIFSPVLKYFVPTFFWLLVKEA